MSIVLFLWQNGKMMFDAAKAFESGFRKTPIANGEKVASVILPVLCYPNGSKAMLFTKRASTLRLNPGDYSFPGGHYDGKYDKGDLLNTGIRETKEEIGIDINPENLIARLQNFKTRLGIIINPFVVSVDAPVDMRLNKDEVESTLEVPLNFLLDDKHYKRIIKYIDVLGKELEFM
jgi:8-oxo-dGTP pyrophosphatase MutT (NUDIX family)